VRAAWLAAVAAAGVAGACTVERKVPYADSGADVPGDAPAAEGAPETMITAGPGPFSRQSTVTFAFTSDDPAARFECSFDGAARVACASPYTRTLADGVHAFSVCAVGAAGNGDPTPAERTWTIDTVAPDTMLLSSPPSVDNSTQVQFAFRSNEAGAAFECSLDSAAYAGCTSGSTFGPVADGPHAFAVRARDAAGNLDASPAIRAWVVDTSTPDTLLLSGPQDTTQSRSATFTFVSPDAGAGATFQCSLDGASFTACASPRNFGGLSDGDHVFAVRVRDAAGNVDPTPATRSWTVDPDS
jgi:hypothetical protein